MRYFNGWTFFFFHEVFHRDWLHLFLIFGGPFNKGFRRLNFADAFDVLLFILLVYFLFFSGMMYQPVVEQDCVNFGVFPPLSLVFLPTIAVHPL